LTRLPFTRGFQVSQSGSTLHSAGLLNSISSIVQRAQSEFPHLYVCLMGGLSRILRMVSFAWSPNAVQHHACSDQFPMVLTAFAHFMLVAAQIIPLDKQRARFERQLLRSSGTTWRDTIV